MVFYFTIPAKSSTVNISSAFTPVPGHIYGTGYTAPEGGFYGSCPARTYAQMSTYTSLTDSGKQTDYFLEVKMFSNENSISVKAVLCEFKFSESTLDLFTLSI